MIQQIKTGDRLAIADEMAYPDNEGFGKAKLIISNRK
jgi:hypothetical protein